MMCGKKFIAALAVLTILMYAPINLAKQVNAAVTSHQRSRGLTIGAEKQESIVFAQNDNSTPDDKAKTTPGTDTTESKPESAPAEDEKNKSSKAESKPLKPFVPSEKIPGEQAVDFPVDI